MKKFNILLVIIFAANIVNAQDWKWLNPSPQGNTLNSIKFVNSNTGYAIGEYGTIIKTTDGGMNWALQSIDSIPSFSQNLLSTCFINADTGYAVGYNNNRYPHILKTTNGGNNWFSQKTVNCNILYSVHFINSDKGIVVGSNGLMLKTSDGGVNWVSQNSNTTHDLESIFFINDSIGFITGSYMLSPSDYRTMIFKTTNGGDNWYKDSIRGDFHSTFFTDSATGYLIGQGKIMKTINGGTDWSSLYTFSQSIHSGYFLNKDTGYVVGGNSKGVILKTTNGGVNWISQNDANKTKSLKSVYFMYESL